METLGYYDDAPEDEVDVGALMTEVAKIRENNLACTQKKDAVVDLSEKQALARIQVEEKKAELAGLVSKFNQIGMELGILQTALVGDALLPVDEIEKQIATAGSINRKVQDNIAYSKQEEIVGTVTLQVEKAEANLLMKREERISIIEAADFPIDGLSIDANGVIYNGIPLDQASSAERLRTSIAMSFAMNPTLNVVLIPDASLLDDANREMIREMAKAREEEIGEQVQVWMEVVGDDAEAAVILVDGEIKEENNESNSDE